jgi:hypothetical protein
MGVKKHHAGAKLGLEGFAPAMVLKKEQCVEEGSNVRVYSVYTRTTTGPWRSFKDFYVFWFSSKLVAAQEA